MTKEKWLVTGLFANDPDKLSGVLKCNSIRDVLWELGEPASCLIG